MTDWIPAETLRLVMRQWATGVALLTLGDQDHGHGMTINSFISISLDPALILVSIARNSRSHRMALDSGRFAVSILRSDQQELSDIFAGRISDDGSRFAGLKTRTTPSGIPVPEKSLAVLDCSIDQMIDAGTHTVFIARVEHTEVSGHTAPLLYFNQDYRKIAE